MFLGSIGIRFRIVYVVNTQGLGLVLLVLLLSFIPKILSTVIASQFYGMSVLDGVSIGLLMNTKGILPILMLNNAWDKQVLLTIIEFWHLHYIISCLFSCHLKSNAEGT